MTPQELAALEEKLEAQGWLLTSRYVQKYSGWLSFASRGNALSSYRIAATRHDAREAVCEWAEESQKVFNEHSDTIPAPAMAEGAAE